MRKFTDKERDILLSINNHKKENNFKKLWFFRLLAEIIPGYYITWDSPTKKYLEEVTLFLKERNIEIVKSQYKKFVDFVLLLEELEQYNLISIRHGGEEASVKNTIFDYNSFELKTINEEKKIIDIISQKEVTNNDNFLSHSERLDIVDLIKKYHSSTIYPLPLLNDFIENDFRSIEERRYDEQLCRTNLSIIVAAMAIIIPLVYEKCCSDNVTTYDAQEIATAIKELKTTELDSITQQFDTLELKVLAPHTPVVNRDTSVKPAPKPQQEPLKQPLPNN